MSTLLSRRTSMWYWCNAGGLAPNPPAGRDFFKQTTESLQFVKSKIGFNTTPKKKNYLGLNELIQLIEYDVSKAEPLSAFSLN